MATATNLADSLRTRTLKYKHSSATVKNTLYLLGGRVMVAVSDALANAENIFIHASERIEMPKAAVAVTAGATLYWDNTNNNITTTSTSNTKCGIAVEDAAEAATTLVMELTNAVNY